MINVLNFKDNFINEYVIEKSLTINDIFFKFNKQNVLQYQNNDNNLIDVPLNQLFNEDGNLFLALDNKRYYYNGRNEITIFVSGDIKVDGVNALIKGSVLIVRHSEFKIYVNNQVVNIKQPIQLQDGDTLVIGDIVIIYNHDKIISLGKPLVNSNLKFIGVRNEINANYENSPRLYKKFNEESKDILSPPSKVSVSKMTIVKLIIPPLIAMVGSIAMVILTKRTTMLIVGGLTTTLTLAYSITSFIHEKKEAKRLTIERQEAYNKYLLKTRKECEELYLNEKDVYNYNFPSQSELADMIMNDNPRLYERDTIDEDFLHVSLGYSDKEPHYELKYMFDEFEGVKDDLSIEGKKVYDKYTTINNVQNTIDLKQSHVGIIGDEKLVQDEVKRIILELSFFHSYHNVKMIMLTTQSNKEEFKFLDWLPHFCLHEYNLRTNISNDKLKEQVLATMYQILKQRDLELSEKKEEAKFNPHYIIFVDNYKLIMNHPIMEYLSKGTELGCTLVISARQYPDLIASIKTIVNIRDRYNAVLVAENGMELNYQLQRDTSDVDYDTLSRHIAIKEHKLGVTNSIPDIVTFLEMFNVTEVSELDIKSRWQKANIHKNMAVPLGKSTENDLVYLNLHEKAHGPHGLVAGTTGSGKSEIIQSYILSLVVNFSPYDVGFLLIDFKGGGMANLFKDLPHLIGTITNLDGAESMRALASIKSELARRQRIFNEHDVNNINLYHQIFKEGQAKEPMPHLFIISDEFAELKKEQPEFMKELVSVARIGRTLGVHLILATQKPTGVVDDQIWSNSKFKLALKVQDESDSKEILKTPDAAYITKTGRAYLQVGNNEIYELFQSAWSGAKYNHQQLDEDEVDDYIYLINDLGQEQLINEDLSDNVKNSKAITELDAVIGEVKSVHEQGNYQEIVKAWLPSLRAKIINPAFENFTPIDLSTINEVDVKINVGLIDIPDKQLQEVYAPNFAEENNLAIFGSSGYGKTFSMANIIMDLAIKNNPELLYFYVLDFGNSGLISFKSLAHVADYISFNNIEKLPKFINIINKEMEKRKELLFMEGVQNVDVYEQETGEKLPRIMIAIDNYDVAREVDKQVPGFIEIVSRDGASLGISLIITATKVGMIKAVALNNIKNRFSHYMLDESDLRSAIGRTEYNINSKQKGRALVKVDNVYQMQVYTPVEFNDLISFNNNIKSLINQINEKYTGKRPRPIPSIPQHFTSNLLENYDYWDKEVTSPVIGITPTDLLQLGIGALPNLFPIIGPSKSGKTNVLKLLISQTKKPYVFDSASLALSEFRDKDCRYVNTVDGFNEFTKVLENLATTRMEEGSLAVENGEFVNLNSYFNTLEERVIFIDDIDEFIDAYNDQTDLLQLLKDAISVDVKFVFGVNSMNKRTETNKDVVSFVKSTQSGVVLGKQKTFTIATITDKNLPKMPNAIVILDEDMTRVVVPEYVEE